jgi:hypothetical protein
LQNSKRLKFVPTFSFLSKKYIHQKNVKFTMGFQSEVARERQRLGIASTSVELWSSPKPRPRPGPDWSDCFTMGLETHALDVQM